MTTNQTSTDNDEGGDIPAPPSASPKIQLLMLQTILQHRKPQIQTLPQTYQILSGHCADILTEIHILCNISVKVVDIIVELCFLCYNSRE